MFIEKLNAQDKKPLVALYKAVKANLRDNGVYQWDLFYPNGFVIGKDLERGNAYGIRMGEEIIAAVSVDREQNSKYTGLTWEEKRGTPVCIHRLAVHPFLQGVGLGKKLLAFAESHAKQSGGTSIRLDVFTGNPGAVTLYERAGYKEVGLIRFPMRKQPFMCMEKSLQ
jgi:ribosomal protein S18 acetylase RimI-like enzyme